MSTTEAHEADIRQAVAAMLERQYAQAIAAGATPEQAIKALRSLWLEAAAQ